MKLTLNKRWLYFVTAGSIVVAVMTANLTFYIAERNNALKVPNAALRFSPQGLTRKQMREALPESDREFDFASATDPVLEGQTRIVWAQGPDKKPAPRLIKIGITDGVATEVVEGGLQGGEIVIVGQTVSGQSQSQTSQSAPGFRNAPGGPGGGMRPR